MPSMLSRAKSVLVDVPRHGKLAYCLLRDDRVPAAPKAVLLGALGIIVSPLDFPAWIPVLGELDMLALGILAIETFVAACPEDIRREHEEALKAQHRVEIDRHKIDMKEPIRTLGEHQVSLKLHRDVSAHVNVIVTQDR